MPSRRTALVMMGASAFSGAGLGWRTSPAQARERPTDGLERHSVKASKIDPDAVLTYLDAVAAAGLELNSFMLYRDGGVAAEGWWWPYRPSLRHMTHSATKSFVGAGVGLAIAEGRLAINDPVLKFFPGRVSNPSTNLQAMTVENLLTQTSGHAIGISGSAWRPIKTSWIDEFLKVPVPRTPGEHFAYSSANSFMLSAIVTEVTGLRLADYMRPRLFTPLGMTNVTWDVSPEGVNPGGNGLSVTTADLLKLGVLYLEGGRWRNRQVLPADWVRETSRAQHGNPYSYQWWIAPDGLGYFAAGKFGQFTFVFPGLNAVMAITAGVPDNAATRERMHSLAFEHVPRMIAGARVPQGADRMAASLANLRALPRLELATSPMVAHLGGRIWTCPENPDGIRELRLDFTGEHCRFELEDRRGRHVITNGLKDWREGETTMTGGYLHHEYEPDRMRVVAGARWASPDRLVLTWQFVESGFRDTVELALEGDVLTYDRSVNINSGPLKRPTVRFTRA